MEDVNSCKDQGPVFRGLCMAVYVGAGGVNR